jgi:hypothetical protein
MPFERIESALANCKVHIDSLDKTNPITVEIEGHLVSGLVVLIVSEYEGLIEEMIAKRVSQCGDVYVIQYIKNNLSRKFRSPDLGKITEVLGQFGGDYKKLFSDQVLNTEYHAAWDNIMTARHAIVHKNSNLNLTLDELTKSYPKTKFILERLKDTLGI